MEQFGISRKLINLAKMSVLGSKCKLKVNGEISEDIEVNTGVRQGDGVFPLLFNLAIETALQEVRRTEMGIRIGTNINILAYADDNVACARYKKN